MSRPFAIMAYSTLAQNAAIPPQKPDIFVDLRSSRPRSIDVMMSRLFLLASFICVITTAQQPLSAANPQPPLASSLFDQANTKIKLGNYTEAKTLLTRSLLEAKKHPRNKPTVAEILTTLATVYTNMGKYDEAINTSKQVLELAQKHSGSTAPRRAAIFLTLGDTYRLQGKHSNAEDAYKKSLAIARQQPVAKVSNIEAALIALGSLQVDQKNYGAAEKTYSQLLALDKAKSGSHSPAVASDLTRLAEVSHLLKKEALADNFEKQAQSMKAALRGSGRLKSAHGMLNPRVVSRGSGEPVKAKWALVVGVSNFKDSQINLHYPAKDASDFRNYLVSAGRFPADHVRLLIDGNATRENIVSQMGDNWLGRVAGEDDLVVIYISSHGSTKAKADMNFLVAWDTRPEALLSTGIPMQWLSQMIEEQVPSNRVILILDVCHSGAATPDAQVNNVPIASNGSGGKGLERVAAFDVEKVTPGSNQALLCSSLADQTSWESKRYQNSVFTRRLIEALTTQGDKIKLSDAYKFLRNAVESEVLRDRGELQTPVLNMSKWQADDPVLSTPQAVAKPPATAGGGEK